VGAPTDDELHLLLQTLMTLLTSVIRKCGVLVEDLGQTCLAEPDDGGEQARTLRPLAAARSSGLAWALLGAVKPCCSLATLWADMLTAAGIATTAPRQYASSIAGERPPDQSRPELWVQDESGWSRAKALLHELQHPAPQRWACPRCRDIVDGPFE